MTNQPQTPAQTEAEKFRAELRAEFAALHEEIKYIAEELTSISELTTKHAEGFANVLEMLKKWATNPQPASQAIPQGVTGIMRPGYWYQDIRATQATWGVSEKTGNDVFRLRGHPYAQHGVTIYPEVLSDFGLDEASLKEQRRKTINFIARVEIKVGEKKDGSEGMIPNKIIGRGDGTLSQPTPYEAK